MENALTRRAVLVGHLELTTRYPDVVILMVTTDPSKQLEIEARRMGIKGFCPKNQIRCLLRAIETLLKGGTYFAENAAA